MSVIVAVLAVITPALDNFWLPGSGLSFLIIALSWLSLNRRRTAALALALGAGLITDIIFPDTTFGFWIFYNLAAWWLIDRLARSVFSGRGLGGAVVLIFLSALLYAAGLEVAGYFINFWQTGRGRASINDLGAIVFAGGATAGVGAVILRKII